MKRIYTNTGWLLRTAAATLAGLAIVSASALADDGFTPLFNGKDLSGWTGAPGL